MKTVLYFLDKWSIKKDFHYTDWIAVERKTENAYSRKGIATFSKVRSVALEELDELRRRVLSELLTELCHLGVDFLKFSSVRLQPIAIGNKEHLYCSYGPDKNRNRFPSLFFDADKYVF